MNQVKHTSFSQQRLQRFCDYYNKQAFDFNVYFNYG